MSVIASDLVPIETQATQDEVWEMAHFFSHNWADACVVRSSWLNSIGTARSDAEKRLGLMDKPYRTQDSLLSVFGRNDVRAMHSALARMGTARSIWPLFPDQSMVTGIAGLVLTVDTRYRRFAAGARCILTDYNGNRITNFKALKIASLTTTTITLAGTETVPAWAANAVTRGAARIYPCMEVDIETVGTLDMNTDEHGTANALAFEAVGRSALPASATPNELIAELPNYRGWPILEVGGDWSKVSTGISRSGNRTNLGIGFNFELLGPRARQRSKAMYKGMDRAESWRLIRLFDSRRGMLFPFMVVRPDSQFIVTDVTSRTITVQAFGALLDWGLIEYVYLRRASGITIRKLGRHATTNALLVARVGESDTITIASDDADIPAMTAAEVRASGPAYLGRFASDEMAERWLTDSHVIVEFDFIEVLNEKEVIAANA